MTAVNLKGKPYLTMAGSDADGWRMCVYTYTEDSRLPGEFCLTQKWLKPKTYETLEAMLKEAIEVLDDNQV